MRRSYRFDGPAGEPFEPTAAGGGPLLVVCALGVERWALRGGDWTAPGMPARGAGRALLTATGMGPVRARRSVTALLSGGGSGYGALLATGFCAAAGPGIRPGDAVVAAEVRDEGQTSIGVPSCGLLADALRARGLTVHLGRIHSADRVVRGAAARRRLHDGGALGIDMETAAVLDAARRAAPGLPGAAVRIVVDTPEQELLRPGTVPSGVRAWRALRSAVPAFTAWHHALAPQSGATDPTDPSHPTETPIRTLPQEAS
ncbi:phosphorylase family protein [Peterkaempfera bronchialis]|uniref:1-hydroxy-2-methyl-2-butenyl 4-diphosphate reductase n=1 Tax=Peterkaempfera bronchialis TaxID=2126346 RepID=A0A345SSR2_9ACTN|nr:1-hydroxy-2-methyl-2-butenyl 4-diphosphate reductase [Peterkaempfera bronchialis]AXI76767.1 1-hydroxy-2-methyl-2-butenyl 4-diphosphate reductase [Peterkaempfera bronchialis]